MPSTRQLRARTLQSQRWPLVRSGRVFHAQTEPRGYVVQATGRAMRKSPATQKTTGSVLVPLFLEQAEGETIEMAVARAQPDEAWVIFQALQEHDEGGRDYPAHA